MSYASIEEAFQSSLSVDEPIKKLKKSKKSTFSRVPEPLVIEPDRPSARPPRDVEILSGVPIENTKSSSLSNFLVAAPDPSEDYFPYPLGADDDKQFLLEPSKEGGSIWKEASNWLSIRRGPTAELPIAPSTPVDGYDTLWKNIPNPMYGGSIVSENRKAPVDNREEDLKTKVDRILQRLDSEDYRSQITRDVFSEILLFVLFGVTIILLLDLFFRSQQSALVHMMATSMKQMGGGVSLKKMTRNKTNINAIIRHLKKSGLI
jgi:hypothetical protein